MTRSKRHAQLRDDEIRQFVEAARQFAKVAARLQSELKISGEHYQALSEAHRAAHHAIGVVTDEWISWARPPAPRQEGSS
jgi:hypothetical protein